MTTKFIIISKDKLTEKDQETHRAAILWKNEDTLEESLQYVLRINEDNEDMFRRYKKYTAEDIKKCREDHCIFDEVSLDEKMVQMYPFSTHRLENGKSLFKRIHGVHADIAPGTTSHINFVIPYDECKFSGASIFGGALGDTFDFKIVDTNYVVINQFGYNVELCNDVFNNTSNYSNDLYKDMMLCCEYTNNGTVSKYIALNLELHEVK